ncbi:MAG: PilZ domain-containing protein [Magnetococcales bacterium]|nr:PilZ domain-containing protein [Magnetococcales bacterium]MBF0584138.1 PilZ domain-containing protein [Magnetococcales bacterium]
MALNPEVQRRAYVRVEDLLLLSWRRVEPEERAQVAVFFERNCYFPPQPGDDVRRVLATLSASHELAQLQKSQPDLAHVLTQMDTKLNLVLRLLHPDLNGDALRPTRVSLSGGGIAFWVQEPSLGVGDFLEVHLTLAVDALAVVRFFVRVMRLGRPDAEGLTQVACQFDPIMEDTQEQIVQHVFKRQTSRLRLQRSE